MAHCLCSDSLKDRLRLRVCTVVVVVPCVSDVLLSERPKSKEEGVISAAADNIVEEEVGVLLGSKERDDGGRNDRDAYVGGVVVVAEDVRKTSLEDGGGGWLPVVALGTVVAGLLALDGNSIMGGYGAMGTGTAPNLGDVSCPPPAPLLLPLPPPLLLAG